MRNITSIVSTIYPDKSVELVFRDDNRKHKQVVWIDKELAVKLRKELELLGE